MDDHIPTVEDILNQTAVSNGFHDFAVEGGTIRISIDTLRQALENAYDPNMPNWVTLVDESDLQESAE